MKPYHHGNLREALLDAAERLLAGHGAEAVTLREVARAAGVSHGAPYHHFDSRDALLAAVAQRGFDGLGAAMAAAGGGTPRERLAGICEAYVDFAARHPARFLVMFGPLLARKEEFPELQRTAVRSFQLLLDGSLAVSPEQGLQLALAGWSMAHGLSQLSVNGVMQGLPLRGKPPAPAQLARQLADWLLATTSAPRGRARPRP